MIHTLVGLTAAAAVLTGVAAAPAAAQTSEPAAHVPSHDAGVPSPAVSGYSGGSGRPGATAPKVRLTLTYQAEAGFAAAVKLTCHPIGGGHPTGAQACATLDAAGGDPDRIPSAPTMCPMIYAPIVATVTGWWRGTTVTWRHRYSNSCVMRRATGVLFVF